MKKFSKLLALLLALAMMFSLAACASEDEAEEKTPSIIGKWDCEMNVGEAMGKYMEESMGTDVLAPDTELRMNIILEFDDDGMLEMTMKINEGDFEKYVEELCEKMIDYLYDTLEAQGLNKELADALINAQYGKSMRDYVDETMDAAMGSVVEQLSRTEKMYYQLDKEAGLIYTADTEEGLEEKKEALEYKLESKKLTLVNVLKNGEPDENPLAAYGLELPWVFEKQ